MKSWLALKVATAQNKTVARQVARESIVLLKNDQHILPLSKSLKRIAVIGPNADNAYNQLGDYTAPQAEGKVQTLLTGIRAAVGNSTKVDYVKGCAIRDTSNSDIAAAVADSDSVRGYSALLRRPQVIRAREIFVHRV